MLDSRYLNDNALSQYLLLPSPEATHPLHAVSNRALKFREEYAADISSLTAKNMLNHSKVS